jgi:hypothetical protein
MALQMVDWHQELHQFLETLQVPMLPDVAANASFRSWHFTAQNLTLLAFSVANFDEQAWQFTAKMLPHKPQSQHLRKILLWEDAWRTKPEVVQSRLRALLGQTHRVPARLTEVRRIDKPTLDAFLEHNHLQTTTTAKYKYGLFLPERHFSKVKWYNHPPDDKRGLNAEMPLAVASFSGLKNIPREGQIYRSAELIRFCNLLNFTIVGGLDKLLKNFVKEVQPDDIMTYADRDWSSGGSYEKLGFEFVEAITPQQFWINSRTFERQYATRMPSDQLTLDWVKIKNLGSWKFLWKCKEQ